MKKMISFALALIMVLVLVACGDNPASNGGNTQNETVTLRASTPTAPEHPWSKCLDNIAAQIKEKPMVAIRLMSTTMLLFQRTVKRP